MDNIFTQILYFGKWVVVVVAFVLVIWILRTTRLASKNNQSSGELLKFDPYTLMKHASKNPSSENAYIIYSKAKDMVLMCTSEGMAFVSKDMKQFAWHMSEETADTIISILNECGYEDLQLQVCNNLITLHEGVSII